MAKILLIKTSSLGDVIHALPAVTDLREADPDATVHWVVEEAFSDLPALHPGVARVIPVAIRRWRRALGASSTWREMGAFVDTLRSESYDLVLDSQGLLKSAAIAALARGPRCGLDRHSAREPLAALAYHRPVAVPRPLHAVERNRRLMALAVGYVVSGPADYGLRVAAEPAPWWPTGAFAVFLHATSRADKEWPEDRWLALEQTLAARDIASVLPWGNARERARAERLAGAMRRAIVAPPLRLGEAAALLAGARLVVGVDTGLTHLAAALEVPAVALYCASEPGLTGVLGRGPLKNLGGWGSPPDVDAVLAALDDLGRV